MINSFQKAKGNKFIRKVEQSLTIWVQLDEGWHDLSKSSNYGMLDINLRIWMQKKNMNAFYSVVL